MKNRPVIEQAAFSPPLLTVESRIGQVDNSPPRYEYLHVYLKRCTCYISHFFTNDAQQSPQQHHTEIISIGVKMATNLGCSQFYNTT